MNIKRKILIGLLATGTVLGFGSGFASLHWHRHHKQEVARHLSRVCVDAAMAAREGEDRMAIDEESHHRHRRMRHIEREVRYLCANEGLRHRHHQ
jgi:hypothetical protein